MKNLIELSDRHELKRGRHAAIVYGDNELTYNDLIRESIQLSNYLQTEKKISAGDKVIVKMIRSEKLIITIFGLLRIGAVFVPVDEDSPVDHTSHIFQDCLAKLLIDNTVFEEFSALRNNYSDLEVSQPVTVNPENEAYIIYTSGSTGAPKGVILSHDGLMNQCQSKIEQLCLTEEDVLLHTSKMNYVGGTWQLWVPLILGATLVIPKSEEVMDIDRLFDLANTYGIDTIELVPSQLKEYVFFREVRNFDNIKTLILTGERIPLNLIKEIYRRNPSVEIWNGYGQTESSNDTFTYKLSKDRFEEEVDVIGKPIINTNVYLLDEFGCLAREWESGQICTSGKGTSYGYINNEELTSKCFIDNPFEVGKKLYKTGDYGRWNENGDMVFLGRVDDQVKVRGNRVELGEIQQHVLNFQGVVDAIAIFDKDSEFITLYYTADQVFETNELRDYLKSKLQRFMLPQHVILLEKFELLANGKINKKHLPKINHQDLVYNVEYVAPKTEVQQTVLELFADLLNVSVNDIGLKHNFFDLGGHSILVTRLLNQLNTRYSGQLKISDIFENPAAGEVADLIEKNTTADGVRAASIKKIQVQDHYPLSYAQRRIWLLSQFEKDSIAYNMPMGVELKGNIEESVLRSAIAQLMDRHESFRTCFQMVDGEPRQKILTEYSVELTIKDLSQHADKYHNAKSLYAAFAEERFNLEEGPVAKFLLIKLSQNQSLLCINQHHIISDGWSEGVLINELFELYETISNGADYSLLKNEFNYIDYTYWHNQLIEDRFFDGDKEYWLNKLADKPTGIDFPLDYQRQPVQTFNGASVSFLLDKDQLAQLNTVCEDNNMTINMHFLSTLGILMYTYSGEKDIIIGSPIAGRNDQQLNNLIGFFVNTVVYRFGIDPHQKLDELYSSVKKEALDVYDHQDFPFDLLIEELNMDRDLANSPLFNVMLAYDNTRVLYQKKGGIEIQPLPLDFAEEVNISKFDLIFFIDDFKDEIKVTIEYNKDLFNRKTIERLACNYKNIISESLNGNDQRIKNLKILGEEEKETLLHQFNKARNTNDIEFINELFEKQVAKTPNNYAVTFENKKLTYLQLNEYINQYANFLIQEHDIKENSIVGICLDRSFEMIIAIWATVKAGAAYLAIDPSYPQDRIEHMVHDSKGSIILTTEDKRELLNFFDGSLISIDTINFDQYSTENISRTVKASSPLYIIYTSGSTGMPNGAVLSHGSLANLVQWHKEGAKIDGSLKCLQFTSINFCVSFQEIVTTLCYGGELFLIGEIERQDIQYMTNFLSENKIQNLYLPFTYLNFLFSHFNEFPDNFKSSLKNIVTAGEQLKISQGLKEFLRREPGVMLHNHYGSSEQHVVTSQCIDFQSIDESCVPSVGTPIKNTQIFILDETLRPCPIGAWGEICVDGSHGFSGYFNNEELTASKYGEIEVMGEKRILYRTGDIGKYRENGEIELKGRKDFQVKIRGFRVELGEIENKFLDISGVENCVVLAKSDQYDQKYLVAYVVIKNVTSEELYRIVSEKLPKYMIPHIVVIEELPLRPNGKVNQDLLPEPDLQSNASKYISPSTNTEKKLAAIWQEILGIERVGIKDNFFEIGGDSLKAVRIVSLISKQLNVKLDLIHMFKSATIVEIARIMDSLTHHSDSEIPAIIRQKSYPLNSTQRRIWIMSQLEDGNISNNIVNLFSFSGNLDVSCFTDALLKVIENNESLRTVFRKAESSDVRQEIMEGFALHEVLEIDNINNTENSELLIKKITAEVSNHLFDLENGPLFRINLIQTGDAHWQLILNMHHIISDAWSIANFVNEINTVYNHIQTGTPENIQAKSIQYVDFIAWQKNEMKNEEYEEQKKYWKEKFAAEIPVLDLPTDFARPKVKSFKGDEYRKVIDAKVLKKLKEFLLNKEATLYMGLVAAVQSLLYKYTGQEEIIIGTPVAGRKHADLEDQIGLFLNMIALKLSVTPNSSFDEIVNAVKEEAIESFKNDKVPIEYVIENLGIKRDPSRSPLFGIMVVLQNTGYSELFADKNEQFILGTSLPIKATKYDLTFDFVETNEGLSLNIEYNSDLFLPGTIERLADNFEFLISSLMHNPDGEIRYADYVSPSEKSLIESFNPVEVTIEKISPITKFHNIALSHPDQTALEFEGKTFTYKKLSECSNQFANFLKTEYNINKNDGVCIRLERNEYMMFAMIAILSVGAHYIPVHPFETEERLAYVAEDCKFKVIIDEKVIGKFVSQQPSYAVSLEHENIDLSSLAYVMYTSGSTGVPKGVRISHDNLANFCEAMNPIFYEENGSFLAITNITFDISFLELIWPLTRGYRVLLKDIKTILNEDTADLISSGFENYFQSLGNVFIQSTPSLLELMLPKLEEYKSAGMLFRKILLGGELVTRSVIQKVQTIFENNIEMYNMYGPTETTIWSTFSHIHKEDEKITIGKPVLNTEIYITDEDGYIKPIGVAGEICIAGKGVSKGYLNRENLTNERFVQREYAADKKIYLTGDIGKWTDDGQILFIGRKDNQIKLNGQRIELGEIENAVTAMPGIDAAVAVLKENNEKGIYVFFVAPKEISIKDLRSFLSKKLPPYMIPSGFRQMETFPLNNSGKADRKALLNIDIEKSEAVLNHEEPINEQKLKILEIWSELLGRNILDQEGSFFELGGSSLHLIKLQSRLIENFNVRLSFADLFENNTVKELSDLIYRKTSVNV
ncbi:non-ribosomal peptide synthetase [Chryseobacterium sp. WLY505]|uniref:non-ribosomal peptide synthetase n=1 Tax=Chryseobacterium sp. WLY505 TaxID=3068892 RepID=UPI002796B24C|nr:non-ribosomal peptide synthetase [Chryseobacterium sp. WLY505]MDQ1858293.1 amino acid adenylation domain-containing protein [Chryseobacterium sp. WLY505]